jgi:hypothetical protein
MATECREWFYKTSVGIRNIRYANLAAPTIQTATQNRKSLGWIGYERELHN